MESDFKVDVFNMGDFCELNIILKFIISIYFLHFGRCTIVGLSYLDPLRQRPLPPGNDPCNSLYWYPRPIPEYCYIKPTPNPIQPGFPPQPIPMPIPIPLPQPLPIAPMIPSPMMGPPAPLPFGVPFEQPSPILPPPFQLPPAPYPYPPPYGGVPYGFGQAGMVPGLPGLVSPDGGINILPFSDVYADVLEDHKRKMVRKGLQKMLDNYGGKQRYRRHRSRRRNNDD